MAQARLVEASPAEAPLAEAPLAEALSVDPSDTTRVDVRLLGLQLPNQVELSPVRGTVRVRLREGSDPILRLRPGDTASLRVRGDELAVEVGGRGLYTPEIVFDPSPDVTWTLSWRADGSERARTYVGSLTVEPDSRQAGSLLLVNATPLEEYVASVVAAEYSFDDLEGAKAMAVVARTYALKAADKFEGRYDHVDHTGSQVYNGTSAITGLTRRAARETRGEVVTYADTLIQAVYFSSSGGHTADNEDVWNADRVLPYLRGKRDPYDTSSPHHRWTTRINRQALLRALDQEHDFSVEGFVIGARSEEGRVTRIDVLDARSQKHPMQANAFRLLVNQRIDGARLKSTWFDARRSGSRYEFDGRGFGHGVGLSQWGTHEMATRGKSYREILTFYYTGVEIQRLDGVQIAPTLPPVAQEEAQPTRDTGGRIGW